jgi:hypothetical protein
MIRVVKDFNMNNWPVHTAHASVSMRSMRKTHQVRPLPAYDVDNKLICPQDYRSKLRGALVQILFTMTHWPEPGRGGKPPLDTFVADILGLRVINEPISMAQAICGVSSHPYLRVFNEREDDADERDESKSESRRRSPRKFVQRRR